MKGVSVAAPGAPYEVVTGLDRPVPGKGQVLVKSMFAGINPVETFQQGYGMLVDGWPMVIGCDASGTIVELGPGVTKFKVGDKVFGCCRLGVVGHGTFQEFFLMEEHVTFYTPSHISLEQAATLGVGVDTASLGLLAGLGLELPAKGEMPSHDEWVVILGGTGSVGQFAIQIAKACGYKILATCSPAKASIVKGVGASAVVDYKLPMDKQLDEIKSVTGGNFNKVFDSSAASSEIAFKMLTEVSKSKETKFATVDDWTPMTSPSPSLHLYRIQLGALGKTTEEGVAVTANIASYIPKLEPLLETGKIKPMAYKVLEGLESVGEAVKLNDSKTLGGTKVIVKIG